MLPSPSMNRVSHNQGQQPLPPHQPVQQLVPWSFCPPQNAVEAWNHQRRLELLNLATPITMGLLRASDLQGTAGDEDEPWKQPTTDRAALDTAVAERAVGIALALQAACDQARPRI